MIIRFCISLAAKSAFTYDELHDSNIVVLPSRRTLRNYWNAIKPNFGFNPPVIAELNKLTSKHKSIECFFGLALDEIKVKLNLVFNKYHDELNGFVNFGDPEPNYGTSTESDKMVMRIFWKTVSILELACNVRVIAIVSDRTSPNRKFYQIHHLLYDMSTEL